LSRSTFFLVGLLALTPVWALPEALSTVAERSGFQRTGRYDEVPALCQAFAKQWPDSVRWETFGHSPEGRPLLAMVVSRSGTLDPAVAQSRGLPVLMVQGGIHAGEIDGKDAGFWALRDLLEKDDPLLKKVIIVFVPVFNVDGHERFGPWNRPNQSGPEEMGWRVTSQNLNLNRDYAKADSKEMLAMLGLLKTWDPILYVDLHATNGAQFQPDIALLVEPRFVGDTALMPATRAMQLETIDRLRAQGSMPLDFYPSARDHQDPSSGFVLGANTARFSTGYWPLRNRMAMLVETHSWKDYPIRVKITRNTIVALAELTARDGAEWLAAAARADENAQSLAGQPVALTFKADESKPSTLEFPGYAYQRPDSAISGAKATIFDPATPQVWRVPFYDIVMPNLVVSAPRAGYLVPASHASWLGEKLTAHGIAFRTLTQGQGSRPLEVFRAQEVKFSSKPVEGHMTANVRGAWSTENHSLPPGSLFVPIDQPKARLLMTLLEPEVPDSFAGWGFFNAHFEQKEYMEEYVAEQVAADMLATDPDLKARFEQRLRDDPEFARDPAARLDFFYRRHPSWDNRWNLYPVMRTQVAPDPKVSHQDG
jgi:hypothetical protein